MASLLMCVWFDSWMMLLRRYPHERSSSSLDVLLHELYNLYIACHNRKNTLLSAVMILVSL